MKVTIQEASTLILKGKLVAVPTETVYGLAASLRRPKTVEKIFKKKGRPQDNPLIVHVATYTQLKRLIKKLPPRFEKVKQFWPGPLTVVFDANKKKVPKVVRAGLDTVAVRMPNHFLLYKLMLRTGPIAAPSANISGRPSPTKVRHIYQDFGIDMPVLKGGPCIHGVESTVIRLNADGWELLRHGAITQEELEEALGEPPMESKMTDKPKTPGQKYRHYAPKAKLKIAESSKDFKEELKKKKYDAVLGFEESKTKLPKISLGGRNNFQDNLRKFYTSLRDLDREGFKHVLVDAHFDQDGLGRTLWERLNKAAGVK